jgi:hypothetical protein
MNVLTLKTPLAERIDRWATSGLAKSILLHPSDYYVLSKANLLEKIESKYSLPVTVLGGENAYKEYVKEKFSNVEGEGE